MRTRFVLRGMAVLITAITLGACATPAGLRVDNRANLARLSIGMHKQQVMDLMGYRRVQDITNPYRTESYRASESVWEVLFYYTDIKAQDGAVEEGELTPVVFRDGRLEGWGWSYWENAAQSLSIRIRR